MKALIIEKPQTATDSFIFSEIEKPTLRPGHLLVQVKATSVNPIDTKVRKLALPFSPDFPAVLHGDFAGVVAEKSDDVKEFNIGEKVYGCGGGIKGTAGGALAQYLLVDANLTSLMPQNLTFEEAATLPLVAITSWEAMIDKLNIQRGNTLLVHGGLGGVGHVAAQLGKAKGAIVHTTVSSDADAEVSKQLGAAFAINRKTTTVEEYVTRFTDNQGFDFVFDTVGGTNLEASFEATRLNGSIACIATGGSHDLTKMYVKGISLHSVLMLIPLMTGLGRSHFGKILSEIKNLVEEGKIKPFVHPEVFDWKDISKAHALLESGKQRGKIAVKIT